MVEYKRRDVDFAIKTRAEDGSTGVGYCSAFHSVDSYTEIVAPMAFDTCLASFLAEGFMAINHAWDEPVGKPTDATVDNYGLLVEWKVADTRLGLDCRRLLSGGYIKRMSIGYRTAGYEDLSAEEVQQYWRQHKYQPTPLDKQNAAGGARLLTKIDPLFEASFVSVPANPAAVVTGVKHIGGFDADIRTFERWLNRECGLSHTCAKQYISSVKAVASLGAGSGGSMMRHSGNLDGATILRRAREAKAIKDQLHQELALSALKTIEDTRKSIERNANGGGNCVPIAPHEMRAENRRVLLSKMTEEQVRKMDPNVRYKLFHL